MKHTVFGCHVPLDHEWAKYHSDCKACKHGLCYNTNDNRIPVPMLKCPSNGKDEDCEGYK